MAAYSVKKIAVELITCLPSFDTFTTWGTAARDNDWQQESQETGVEFTDAITPHRCTPPDAFLVVSKTIDLEQGSATCDTWFNSQWHSTQLYKFVNV
ncbi:hypothetical protein TNCV_526091 [Trichonephila clavipes]|nr:hypothetical protein TNCV_526091 [Trichonephila clavipes]